MNLPNPKKSPQPRASWALNKVGDCLLLLLLVSSGSAPVATAATPEEVAFYTASVRPILAEHCYSCHGGGEVDKNGHVKVKSGLQLISRAGVLKGGDLGPAVDLKNPEASLLLKAISYADDHLKMPPRGKLAEDETAVLAQWIKMGLPTTPEDAERLVTPVAENHAKDGPDVQWTYEPRKPVSVPKNGETHPIDAFLKEPLAAKKLAFSPPSEKEALIRRATYDLTGLPPEPAEVAAFVASTDPNAYEQLLDRLLASKHYGEKYGRHWLDLVRYADSNGFERDGMKAHMWRYRQYVLDSFNEDKPFDQFTREQLAGDELPEANAVTRTATGYWRLMQWDDEPADRKQHMYDVMDDNLRVTAETFLGMTIGCARCHNHKTDPILQKDYYSFMAFFHGLTHFSNADSLRNVDAPDVPIPKADGRRRQGKPAVPLPQESGVTKFGIQRQQAEDELVTLYASVKEKLLSKGGAAIPAAAQAGAELLPISQKGAGQRWDITETKPAEDWAMPGYTPAEPAWRQVSGGIGNAATPGAKEHVNTPWSSSAIWVRTSFQLTEIPESLILRIHHDEDAHVYLNGKQVLRLDGHTRSYWRIPFPAEAMQALQTGKNILAIHVMHTSGTQYIDAGLEHGQAALRRLVETPALEALDAKERKALDFLQTKVNRMAGVASMDPADLVVAQMAVEHGKKAPPIKMHLRGNPHSEGPEVEPAFPVVFNSPLPTIVPTETTSGRRTALANWIVSGENPRTARVLANRLWQWHFGRGLNASTNEWGKQGSGVSHPALLDWLAETIVQQGWRLKAVHKLMMTSKAYQQAAVLPKPLHAVGFSTDPSNQLWWRFEPRRLTSEELRDSVHFASGLLNRTYGGPSFYATMPAEVLATASRGANAWEKTDPAEQGRRSVYMITKRSLQHPLMTDFDQADTDNPCPSRFTTTVPTQALNLLNSQFLNEQASLLAKRLVTEKPGSLAEQISHGLALVTQKPAEPAAVEHLLATEAKLRSEHGLSPDTARERLCLILLNMNAMIYVD